MGIALHRFIDADWRPLATFSKMLKPTEHKCSTFNHELIAVYLTNKHFSHFSEARQFFVCLVLA